MSAKTGKTSPQVATSAFEISSNISIYRQLLSRRFWVRKLPKANFRDKNQAERSRPEGGVGSNALDRRSASAA